MAMTQQLRRREFLQQSAGWAGLASIGATWQHAAGADDRGRLPVAGVTTVYYRNSHADVIFGKILEGFDQQGGPGPGLRLASLYIDQLPKSGLGRELAKKHNVPIFDTIEGAVTVGGKGIPVAGVLSIGEHGDYPFTEKTHQHKYPRRRFFDAITSTFQKHGKVVPVFNDKHLAWNFKDARHMYDTAQRMKIPFMAGSSVPVAWRQPELSLPMGCEVQAAVGIGYGGEESYGFHALEGMQCMLERRKGGETGVASVQAVQGDAILQAKNDGWWSRELMESALAAQSGFKREGWEQRFVQKSTLFLIQYRDSLKATMAMANGVAREFSFAAQLNGKPKPAACVLRLEEEQPYGHFGYLVKAIEHMVHTGKPAYPVERTLLTTGILDRAMHSLADGHRKYETPELNIAYKANEWPFATGDVGDVPKIN
jgi:hypothetical protein